MPKRTLINHRPWLLLGVALAIAFWVLSDAKIGGLFIIAIKGASVAALGAYALARSRRRDARVLAAVIFAGAAGDIGMELYQALGGGLFLLAHVIAIALYLHNRRPHPRASQIAASAALFIGTPIAAWLLSEQVLPVLYAIGLGAMAATAWLSRFSRYHVGIGALLFVASDLLIFARIGGVLDQSLTEWFVWPLYYAGQFLIATGVIRTLRRDHAV